MGAVALLRVSEINADGDSPSVGENEGSIRDICCC